MLDWGESTSLGKSKEEEEEEEEEEGEEENGHKLNLGKCKLDMETSSICS